MSHSNGKVYKDGNVIGYYEYDGISDVVCTAIRRTIEEVHKYWRKDNTANCQCGQTPIAVVLWTDYGGDHGMHWPGKACMRCMAVTDGIYCCDIDQVDGEPSIEGSYACHS